MADRHVGSWADNPRAAIDEAMWEVRLDSAEFVECQFSEGSQMEPVDPEWPWRIDVDVVWCEARQQYRAISGASRGSSTNPSGSDLSRHMVHWR